MAYDNGKKTSMWASRSKSSTAGAIKFHFGRVSICGMREKCMSVCAGKSAGG